MKDMGDTDEPRQSALQYTGEQSALRKGRSIHVAGLSFRALIALPDVTAAAADAAFERCPWHRRLEQQRLCHLVVEVSLQDPAVLEVIAGNAL